ncbi:MAG: hypothetical protein ACI9TK_001523 [Flavobacteriaceae bacterium]|jgi:hypothetical protein
MFRKSFSTIFLMFMLFLQAQIKSPKEYLGYTLGTNFSRHHQVVDYFKHLEAGSESLQLQPYGKTNEGRLLQLVFISSPKNLKNLETIRKTHLQNSGVEKGALNNEKVIVWLSYNVHGNESSSTEAAMKTAYALLSKYNDWLEDTIVILDPCINPDGRDRYVNFYNQTKSAPYDSNGLTREHRESWHNGRSNHYMFDLNRDWAWLSQVESQQRVKKYNLWLPHIHVDFHEQGINSPYYFAPAAEPLHEVVTDFQIDFQDAIGKNHARYFDKEGWFYFTKQNFDLLYPSYGDTYPMFLGSIGMTYEQAGGGGAGLGVDNNENIELTLIDRIEHHYTTGISTVEMAAKNKTLLNKNYQAYFRNQKLKYKNFVLEGNADKLNALASLLEKHEIKSYTLGDNNSIKGFDYQKGERGTTSFSKNAMVVPTNQPKGKMVQVLLEPQTKLVDSLTYDITAWSLPYAYGLKAIATKEEVAAKALPLKIKITNTLSKEVYGHALSYGSFEDAKFIAALLKEGIGIRYTSVPLSNSGEKWNPGSIFVLKGDNLNNKNYLDKTTAVAQEFNRELHPITTGYSTSGPDLGASELHLIKAPRIAILRSDKVSTLSYGEVWHYFEQQLVYPLMQVDEKRIGNALLEIDQLIIPNGYYDKWENNDTNNKIMEWIRKGGKIIAISGALNKFSDTDFFKLEQKKNTTTDMTLVPLEDQERNEISKITTGSIYAASLDKTHPLSFGLENYYSLKLNEQAYSFLENGNNAAFIKDSILPSAGFIGYKAIENQKKSLLFGEESKGRGSIVYLVDNVLFRSFWYSGKIVFANALFF